MAQLHKALNQSHAGKGVQLFADIPRQHAWLHCALAAASSYLNPRLRWCFRQEDNMNAHRTLAQSSCKGTRGPQVTAKMVAKRRVALSYSWTKCDKEEKRAGFIVVHIARSWHMVWGSMCKLSHLKDICQVSHMFYTNL